MPRDLDLTFDISTGALTLDRVVGNYVKRSETLSLSVTIVSNGASATIPSGLVGTLKPVNTYGTTLAQWTTFAQVAATNVYTASTTINAAAVSTLLGTTTEQANCVLDFAGAGVVESDTLALVLKNNVTRDDDTAPTALLNRNDFLVSNGTGLLVNVAAGYAANGAFVAAQASLAITNATNYIEVTAAGVASVNTTAFTAGSYPLAKVVASAGAITSNTDLRAWITPKPAVDIGGTVTSVAQSFTGGLISVAGSPITASGTLALTVAGTSGGIPYFSSATAWATSAALAANALVTGGGAGAAPATVTTGANVLTALGIAVGSAGAFITFNGDAGTPSALVGTNISGTAANLTAGLVSSIGSLTGDVTSSNRATTLATVNSNVGAFTNASLTVNAKGLVTAASSGTSAVTSITGTANEITVTGTTTPTLSLPSALTFTGKTVTGGTFNSGAFNGTVGATTPSTVAGTTGTFSGAVTVNNITYANSNIIVSNPVTATAGIDISPYNSGTQPTAGHTWMRVGGGSSEYLMINAGLTGGYVDFCTDLGAGVRVWDGTGGHYTYLTAPAIGTLRVTTNGSTLGTVDAATFTGNAATVTTNANLTGHVTSVGNAAVLGSFTMAQLSAAVSDGDPAYVGAANTFTTGQTISSTTSLLLGTAGSAVGTIGFRNATSGTTTLQPATGALGTGTVTLPLSGTLATLEGSNTYTGTTNTFTLPTTTGSTTTSGIAVAANSLTTGTGIYAASSTLTSGKLLDLQVSGTAAAASQTALNVATAGANGTSGITSKGAVIANTHTGTTSTNVALELTASGGATANTALNVTAGQVSVDHNGTGALPCFTVGTSTKNTGLYAPVAGYLGLVGNGAEGVRVSSIAVSIYRACDMSSTLAVTGATTLTGNLTSNGAYISTPQALSGNGAVAAVSVATECTTIANTGTANTTTTLAAGTNGQKKVISFITDGGFDAVITVTNPAWGGAGTITMNDALDNIEMRYLNSVWQVFINNGCTLA